MKILSMFLFPSEASRTAGVFTAALLLFLHPLSAAAQSSPADHPTTVSATLPGAPPPVMDNSIFAHVLLDQFEGRTNGPDNQFRWDGEGWIGTDMNKLWIKSEGFAGGGKVSDGDHEVFYDRPLPRMRYFDGQVGVRADLDSGPARTWAALGIEGLAPMFFHLAPTLYVRDGGNIGARISGSYDLLLTQRLVLQPEAEFNFYNKDDAPRETGSGLSDLDTGVRLRYEFSRKFAPYVGFGYSAKYGDAAHFAQQAGDSSSSPRFVYGLRLWY